MSDKPVVMYVLHDGTGGTPQTNLDLMRELDDRVEALLLVGDGEAYRLSRLDDHLELVDLDTFTLEVPLVANAELNPGYQQEVLSLLTRHRVDIVHIRHLLRHDRHLPQICHDAGVPVVLSLHDFYLACPTIQLIDNNGQWCAGRCTAGAGTCRIADPWLADITNLKHDFVYTWRSQHAEVVRNVAAFVTTSDAARSVLLDALPSIDPKSFHVIEHGRDLLQRNIATVPKSGEPVRILVPGEIGVHKGAVIIAEIEELAAGRIEFYIAGKMAPKFRDVGLHLGVYDRDEFADVAELARPHFGGIFSIWGETYSHTLSECWAAGLPVLALDYGAVGERIRRHGGGWLLADDDPRQMIARILSIAADTDDYRRRADEASVSALRSQAAMAADYWDLYQPLLAARTDRDRP